MFMIHPMKLEDTAVMTAQMDTNVPTVVFVSVVRKLMVSRTYRPPSA